MGCSNTVENGQVSPVNINVTHIIISKTEYYTSNPAQMRPADGSLEAGTEVQMIDNAGSYVLIKTTSRISAYISADAVKPL